MVSTSSSDDLTLSFANLSVSPSGEKKRGSDSTLTPNCFTSRIATDKEREDTNATKEPPSDNSVFGTMASTSTAIPLPFIFGTSKCSTAATATTSSKPQSLQMESLFDEPQDLRRVSISAWSTNFENLISDPIGRKAFKDFQSREFSSENLAFYLACRQLAEKSGSSLSSSIDRIYETYLSRHATDPVNIDNAARKEIEAALKNGQKDCKVFSPAETQIYTLMKFDSYHRFLRSDIFAKCASAEQLGKPLPYEDGGEENCVAEDAAAADSAMSPANADEGGGGGSSSRASTSGKTSKRRSFIPWTRISWSTLLASSKTASLSSMPGNKQEQMGSRRPMMYKLASSITKLRSKSLDDQVHNSVRSNSTTLPCGMKAGMKEAIVGGGGVGCAGGPRQGHSSSVDHSTTATRGGSIDCFDVATVFTTSPETGPSRMASLASSSTSAEMSPVGSRSGSGCAGIHASLLRVIYPDGSSTITNCSVPVASGSGSGGENSLDSLIRRLLFKRQIDYTDFEVFKMGESAPLDLLTPVPTLGGCEVSIEVYLSKSKSPLSKSKSHFYELSCVRPFPQSPTSSVQPTPTKAEKKKTKNKNKNEKKMPERARTEESPQQKQQQQQQTMRRFHSASMETPVKRARDDDQSRRSSEPKGDGTTQLGISSSSPCSSYCLPFSKDKLAQAEFIGIPQLATSSATTTTTTNTTTTSPANTEGETSSSSSPKPFLSRLTSSLPFLFK